MNEGQDQLAVLYREERRKRERRGRSLAMIKILQINGIIHGASPLTIGPVIPSIRPQGETCGGYLRWTDKDKGGDDLAA